MFIRDRTQEFEMLKKAFLEKSITVVRIKEPPIERPKSWKMEAELTVVRLKGREISPKVSVNMYFAKAGARLPRAGDLVMFIKTPVEIENFTGRGNSGQNKNFDYKKYCARKQIYFQVFLKSDEYTVLEEDRMLFQRWLFEIRDNILSILKKYVAGDKECGLAEALLVGYRNDMDKDLARAYSATGVVHVVAISGLHLGLIYVILRRLFSPMARKKWGRPLSAILMLAALWMFSLLAGGTPSVVRSAVMFSFVILGSLLTRRSSIYNSLAASAFILLIFDPFWLWDAGFQLSYTALASIVIYMKPVHGMLGVENRWAAPVWQLNAVTIAAQILTFPLVIYCFRQFPVYFLLSNFIAVPLSSLILVLEILLCAFAPIHTAAAVLGRIISALISFMNRSMEWISRLPFCTVEGIDTGLVQTLLLYLMIIAGSLWLIRGQNRYAVHTFAVLNLVLLIRILKHYGSLAHPA